MIACVVTCRGHYEEIALTEWGETNGLDAVHVMKNGMIGAVILEPRARELVWSEDDEHNFLSDVRALVAEFEEQPDELIFDPGRDRTMIERL